MCSPRVARWLENHLSGRIEGIYANGVTRGLTAAGMLVRTAGTAAEAIDTLRADPSWPEVILLDFMLPDGTGAEVLPRLLDIRPDIPVVRSAPPAFLERSVDYFLSTRSQR